MSPGPVQALLHWCQHHGRDLSWRRTRDPYAIWISEAMLQQTRVETAIPYFRRWMARFPDLRTLAQAEQHEVLELWEGLGYYRRAHSLHRAARMVMQAHGGKLPRDQATLKTLPGIGRYTAAAIPALAFDQDALALDGNLRRVIARWGGLALDPRTSEGERRIMEWAEALMPPWS